MGSLREALLKSAPVRKPCVLLKDDWIPSFKRMDETPVMRIGHQSVSVRHDPGRVARHYLFARAGQSAVALELRLTLCLDGCVDANEVVIRTVESHQGALHGITETSGSLSLGDFGYAWAYREAQVTDAMAFARHNVAVFIRRCGDIAAVECARDLDRELQACGTCEAYPLSKTGAFAEVGAPRPAIVKQGQRLDLATEPEDQQWYFSASAGSVNRDPQQPRWRYFRAPSESQSVKLWAYAVGRGMLAQREVLDIDVIS